MKNLPITMILTACYWISALLLPSFMPENLWGNWRWLIAILFYTIPMTVYGWVVMLIVRFVRPSLSAFRFTLISVSLPILWVVITIFTGYRWGQAGERSVQSIEQLRTAVLVSVDDEPVVDAKGPIGVRLHMGSPIRAA